MQGVLLGNYRVLEKLGEGGMGEVYFGRHESLGHSVAVKVLQLELSRDPEMLQRFFNEARAATSIRNPGIVQIFDFGTSPQGRAYFVMELLEGESLAARLKQRRLNYAECCRIGRQVANVLHAAHARGITHRDLKPDNLFLVPDPEVSGGERVKVLDFGIAKLAGEVRAGVKTRTGLLMGTPHYMSPEQCHGAGTVDTRSDIYSMGCILFEMACGRPPFVGEGVGQIVGAHQYLEPPQPLSLASDIPIALSQLILQMLAKHPDSRPPTMVAVGQALDELLQPPGAIARIPTPVPSSSSSLPLHAPSPMPVHAMPPSYPPPPAAARSPALAPVATQPISPSSTTLGSAAAAASTRPSAPTRRLPIVLGGLVVTGALTALIIVSASRGSDPKQGFTDATIASIEPDAQPVAVQPLAAFDGSVAPDAPPTAVPPPPPEAGGSAVTTLSDVEIECLRYQTNEKWADLDACTDRLKSANPALAKNLKNVAVQETISAVRITALEAALRDKDLKKAKAELDRVWPGSTSYKRVRDKYDAAEAAAITASVARLERVNSGDCREYNQILAQERASKPPRVATEAQRRVKCTPIAPLPACDPEPLEEKGKNLYSEGQFAAALAAYEAAIACRPNQGAMQKAFIVACNMRNVPKAKMYWKRISVQMKHAALNICVRNGITEEDLNAP